MEIVREEKVGRRVLQIQYVESVKLFSVWVNKKYIRDGSRLSTLDEAVVKFEKYANYYRNLQDIKTSNNALRASERKIGIENAKKTFKVGDIFHRQWGYNMTINDFYQIVEIKGCRVIVDVLKNEILSGGGWSGHETYGEPSGERVKGSIVGENVIKIVGGYKAYKLEDLELKKEFYYNTVD